jgi:quercetin dioxygenase-like cupin family protein
VTAEDRSSELPAGGDQELVADEQRCSIDGGEPGVIWRRLVPGRAGSSLALDVVALDTGARLTLGSDPGRHQLVYVLGGAMDLEVDGQRISVDADSAFLCDAAAPAAIHALAPVQLAVFGAGPGCDEHAPLGERVAKVALDLGQAGSATGRRSFQVLLGPENGCGRATMFVGVVPPGAAPWHFHQYDEIVYLLDGVARYHQGGGVQAMGPDSAVRIPPRTVHINENVGDGDMRVLGVFTPAGSPAAAYLAQDPRPS